MRAHKRLVIYLMAEPETPELALAAVEGGADIIEIGFPFSDPLADGPIIRHAAERALRRGMRTAACIEVLARTHDVIPDTPLVPMTYSSLLEAYGWERFDTDIRHAGAASMIIADLPAGERPELRRIQLVAPTSTDERIRIAGDQTDGWLYLVTVTGITGARGEVSPALPALANRTRRLVDVLLYAGFGISTPAHAATVSELVDGIVVGSRALEIAEKGEEALRGYVTSLRAAMDETVHASARPSFYRRSALIVYAHARSELSAANRSELAGLAAVQIRVSGRPCRAGGREPPTPSVVPTEGTVTPRRNTTRTVLASR